MLGRLFSFLIVLLVAAVLAVAVWPQAIGFERHAYVAQVVSFRLIAAGAAVALAIVVSFLGLIVRPFRRITSGASVLLVLFAVASGVVIADRGAGAVLPGGVGSSVTAFPAKAAGDLTVLSWNTQGGRPGPEKIAALALAQHADIVSLPETRQATGVQVAELMRAAGRPMWVHTVAYDQVSPSRSTTLLTSTALGTYEVASGTTTPVIPTVVATPTDGTGPTIVAVHDVSPSSSSTTRMDAWRAGLDYLAKACSSADVIMAGDFNATLDQMVGLASTKGTEGLGSCSDSAAATKNAGIGTWPTRLPAIVGTPIDHVMATSQWTTTGMRVLTDQDDAGSDHRPIVAQLHSTGG